MPVGICTRESTAKDDARDDNSALKSADLTGDWGKLGHFSNDYALGKDDGGDNRKINRGQFPPLKREQTKNSSHS